MKVDTLFTPIEISRIEQDYLKKAICIVIDILRATSVVVTALYHGAKGVIPAASIEEALQLKQKFSDAFLAGEIDGFKIPSSMTEGVKFDFGNSPREFMRKDLSGKIIITTTTNGTRAIKAVTNAQQIFVGSFLNLTSTANYVKLLNPECVLIVCSGTKNAVTSEDVLAAGALIEALSNKALECSDASIVARDFFNFHKNNFTNICSLSFHARRLHSFEELAPDISFCMQKDCFNLVAAVKGDMIVKISA